MSSQLILITGATGHVGFGVLAHALAAGYKVRAAVRSEAKAEPVKAVKQIQPYLSQLTFVVVPDITVSGAYDEAVKDVDYIIHVASPIPDSGDLSNVGNYKEGAVKGTTGILNSAMKVASVKRVAITSSTAAIVPEMSKLYEVDIGPDSVGVPPPEPHDHALFAYLASKVFAHQATQQFIKEHNPKFEIISLMPSYVIGPNFLAKTPEELNKGSNSWVLSPILGEQKPVDFFSPIISLYDVARIHVECLTSSKIKKHENFLLSTDYRNGFEWNHSKEVAEKAFPDAVKKGILPLGGNTVETPAVKFDSSKTVEYFGPLRTPKEMIEELVAYYIELASK